MKDLIKNAPTGPGVYKMKDAAGTVIYVGKAKNIRNRIKSYFQKDAELSMRTRAMLKHARDIEYIETDSELEALMLETNVIKELRPRYNILMKDDKSYVYIKINMAEDFPSIRIVREKTAEVQGIEKNPVKYFGPKIASNKVYETLRLLKKLFPYRHCKLDISWQPEGALEEKHLPLAPQKDAVKVTNRVIDFPCLDYFIKRCSGPCIGAISPNEYKKSAQQVVDFLTGKSDELEKKLTADMMEAAEKKLFEKAAKIRDKLRAIQEILSPQKITHPRRVDTDVISMVAAFGHIYFTVMLIRNGKLIDQENFVFDALEMVDSDYGFDDDESLESFITQYYQCAAEIPKEVLIPVSIENSDALETWLAKKRGDGVSIVNPQKGEKNALIELAQKNALTFSKQHRIKWLSEKEKNASPARLAEVLGMKNTVLKRIEGFDISHLGGSETVGSMVVFENGRSKSSDYRHFKMRTVEGKPDDYKSMREVLMRRLKYLQKSEKVSLRKAAKKDIQIIAQWGAEAAWPELKHEPDWQNFYILVCEKKSAGMIRLLELANGIFEISGVFVAEEFRGRKLSYSMLKKTIARIKDKRARIYTQAEERLKDLYLNFGFVTVRDAPQIVKEHAHHWEKLDNKKYEILAYYKGKKKLDDPSFKAQPDLIVIDGGKGQLAVAVEALEALKLNIPVISLAKRLEEIYLPGAKAPLLLNEGDEALKLLQRIRDESHRFAITFQRDLHVKNMYR